MCWEAAPPKNLQKRFKECSKISKRSSKGVSGSFQAVSKMFLEFFMGVGKNVSSVF